LRRQRLVAEVGDYLAVLLAWKTSVIDCLRHWKL